MALQPARKGDDPTKAHILRLSSGLDDDNERLISGDSDRSSGYFSYNYNRSRSDSHGYSASYHHMTANCKPNSLSLISNNSGLPVTASPMASLILSQSADLSNSRTTSLMSEEIEKDTLVRGTPWRAFFTHPAALTLLANNFTYVRIVSSCAYVRINILTCMQILMLPGELSLGLGWVHPSL